MDTNGYLVIRNYIKRPLVQLALEAAKSLDDDEWISIFGSLQPKTMDPFRHQFNIELDRVHQWSFIPEITQKVLKLAKNMQEMWTITRPWVFLRSLPGGEAQNVHRDFIKKDIPGPDLYPGVLMVALESGTKLSVFGGDRQYARRDEETIIELDAGDILIFRGDLIHRGVAYETTNYRLHCHLDIVGAKPVKDHVRPAHFALYGCDNCMDKNVTFDTKAELDDHHKGCLKCGPCGSSQTKKESFQTHMFRKHHELPNSKRQKKN